jgi:hypothetical protein
MNLEGLSQPACLNHSPVTWDYPWNACNFLSSITRIPALSMNYEQHNRILKIAHEMLSTDLFTAAPFYSHTPRPKTPMFSRFSAPRQADIHNKNLPETPPGG